MSRYEDSIRAAVYSLVGMVLLLLLAMLTSCKTRYVTVPEYHTVYSHRTDSFVRTDTLKEKEWMTIKEVDSTELRRLGIALKNVTSAYVIERNKNTESKGEQIVVQRDTLIKTDSVRVPFPVVTEKKLSKWQKLKMDVGGWAIMAVVVVGIVAWIGYRHRRVS